MTARIPTFTFETHTYFELFRYRIIRKNGKIYDKQFDTGHWNYCKLVIGRRAKKLRRAIVWTARGSALLVLNIAEIIGEGFVAEYEDEWEDEYTPLPSRE